MSVERRGWVIRVMIDLVVERSHQGLAGSRRSDYEISPMPAVKPLGL
jgi:hypothetical protein